ncbi:MAG: hypothetical protein WBO10_00090 [Pyrinomonadaceae bacterium]
MIVLISNGQSLEKKCTESKQDGKDFSVVFEARTSDGSKELILDVVLKPKNFTREKLVDFSIWVKAKYCHNDVIGVSLFDNKTAAVGWHRDLMLSGGRLDKRRGTYSLNRSKNEERIEFSSANGKPIDEIVIIPN